MNRVIQRLRFVSIVGIVLWLLFSITFAWADGETGTFTSLGPGHYPVAGTLDGNHRYYGAYTFNFQLSSGGIVPVFCTDLRHYVYYGDTFVASDEVMACPVRWLLLHYPPRLSGYTPWPDQAGALSNINYEMAARQAAVWHFSDGFIPYTGNTIALMVKSRASRSASRLAPRRTAKSSSRCVPSSAARMTRPVPRSASSGK